MMERLDLLDRLLDHDVWSTLRVLEHAAGLDPAHLDRAFDIGHGTVRATLRHMLGNLETWSDLMEPAPVRGASTEGLSLPDLSARFAAAYEGFARVARRIRDADRLDDTYLDVLDKPPRWKTYAGTILHVITHNHMHRSEVLHMLQRLGLSDLIEGDVLGWEAARKQLP
jgi:uncharacterized damage-inducible protein DinB